MQVKFTTEKNIKEQVLELYNETLAKLNEKPISAREEFILKTEKETAESLSDFSENGILIDISTLKVKLIKQADILSEQFLAEFKKLNDLRNAASIERKHLQELYQINETADSLFILLQAKAEQKELLKREKEECEKKRVEVEEELLKKENQMKEKEEFYESLGKQLEQMPEKIKEASTLAEERLRNELLRKHEFDSILKAQEYNSILKLQEQNIKYLEEKVKRQETIIEDLSEKVDTANNQIQSIAHKALDISAGQFISINSNKEVKSAQ